MMSNTPVTDFAQPGNPGQTADYSLPAEFGIYAAAQTQQELQAALAAWTQDGDRKTVSLAGSAVESLDASGVQILVALQRSLTERGLQLQICNASAALHQGLQRMGTGSLLASCH